MSDLTNKLSEIGNAIRTKKNTSGTIPLVNFPAEILSIEGGGSAATLITKNIVTNGTYNAVDDSADGYSSVVVNVPSAEKIKITNGNYLFDNVFYKAIFDMCDFSEMTSMDHFAYFSNLSSLSEAELSNILSSEKVINTYCAFNVCYLPETIGNIYFPSSKDAGSFMSSVKLTKTIGNMDFRAAASAIYLVSDSSVTTIGDVDLSSATNINRLFSNNSSLTTVGHIKFCTTENIISYNSVFYNCRKLKKLLNLNYSRIFGDVLPSSWLYPYGTSSTPAALEELTFETFTYVNTTAAKDIYIPYCSLGHDAIVAMFNTMPTPVITSTITLTGNPGVTTLTDAEKAIATAKNYSLVY